MYCFFKPIIRCIFLLSFLFSFSQDQTIVDSLKRQLHNPKIHDTTRLYIVANLVDQHYLNDDYDQWNEVMGKLALKSLKRKNNKELRKKYTTYLAAYYNNLGALHYRRRNVIQANGSFDKSIALFKSIKVYNEMSYAMIAKGIFLASINDYEKAISCCFEALKYFEKDKNPDGISYAYASLGAIYSNLNEHRKAITYYQKGLHLAEKHHRGTPEDYNVQSELNANCGSAYFLLKDYGRALDYFSKALNDAKKSGDSITTSIVLTKIARLKTEESKFDEAEKKLKEALSFNDNTTTLAVIYVRFGELYYKRKMFPKADFYLTKGLDLAINAKSSELQEQAAELLFKLNREQNNFKKSLAMHLFLDKLKDSINLDHSRNALERQQLKYSFEKKEYRYKLETQKDKAAKNNILISLLAVILLLAMGGWFLYRNAKQKQKLAAFEKSQLRQKLLLSQMNPHFVFNSIDNIKSLIYNKKDDQAVNYLTKFSKLMRQILEHSNENYIALDEEIALLENYLSIQQLLHNNKFEFAIDVALEMDTEAMYIPPMLTQPFIENAIKHGLRNKQTGGLIQIRFYQIEQQLYFEVTDNGPGFEPSQRVDNHKSLGVTMTRERLQHYTKNKNFSLQIENVLNSEQEVVGAKIVFEIPYIYEN